jgi:ankyrin repeat protein
MLAARGGHGRLVEALLAAGADPRRSGDRGATALTMAREAGHAEVVRLLEGTIGR